MNLFNSGLVSPGNIIYNNTSYNKDQVRVNNLITDKMYTYVKRLYFSFLYYIYLISKRKDFRYYFSKWVKDDGDNTLLTKYPLNRNSLVVDVGGYKGFFSDRMINLYHPKIIIFEPVKEFCLLLATKYKNNHNIKLYNYGLSDKSSNRNIYLSGGSTSLIKKSNKVEKVIIKDVLDIFKTHKYLDLMSINIEGEEYKLLNRLAETNMLKRIKYLQVQFHNCGPNDIKLREMLYRKILKTHKIRFSYPFVWESFESK